jgi:hypothetical protein
MIVAMAVSLEFPYRFNQLNLLSKKTLRPRSPASVRTLERAVVRVHDFARLLIIAPRPRVAANRDDARRPWKRALKACSYSMNVGQSPGVRKLVFPVMRRPCSLRRAHAPAIKYGTIAATSSLRLR